MKKHLLLASLFLITLGIHSQNGAKCSGFQYAVENIANKFSKETVAPNTIIKQSIGPIENPNPIESEQSNSMPSTINWKLIGGTNNIFGSLESNSRPLQYNAKLNAVSFVHRKSFSYQAIPMLAPTATNGVIVAQISTNMGATFDSTCIYQDANNWGSFPQGGIYNPAGNTNIANGYFVGCGPTTSSVGFSGNWYASKKLDVFNSTPSMDNQFIASNAASYSTGMSANGFSRVGFSINEDGLAHSLARIADNNITGAGIRGYALVKGVFNAGSFVWTMDSIIPNVVIDGAGNKQIGKAQMAWNESGTVGYVVMLGPSATASLSNRGYQPLIYKTTNSGTTWTQLGGIDFNNNSPFAYGQMKKHITGVKTNSNLAIPLFNDFSLVVDANDKLHLAATFKSTYSNHDDSLGYAQSFTSTINPSSPYFWEHIPGRRPYLYDFIGDGTSPWSYFTIDSLGSQEAGAEVGHDGYTENPWDTIAPNASKTDNLGSRIQLARTPDGKFITFSWSESDTSVTVGGLKYNTKPNIKTRCVSIYSTIGQYRLANSEINVTRVSLGQGVNNLNVTNRATLNYLSATTGSANVIGSFGSYSVEINTPMTVTNSNPNKQLANNTIWYQGGKLSYFFYTGCVTPIDPTIGVKEITQNSISNIVIFPNPTSNNAVLSIDLKDKSIIDIVILNSIGQTLKTQKAQGQIGKNNIAIDLSGLSNGIYLVNIKVGEAVSTKKIVVQ